MLRWPCRPLFCASVLFDCSRQNHRRNEQPVVLVATLGASAAFAAGTLHYGLEAQYPPFESKSASGELQGLDIHIGNAICSDLMMKGEWTESSFDRIIPALQTRQFDVINSPMTDTAKGHEGLDITNTIY